MDVQLSNIARLCAILPPAILAPQLAVRRVANLHWVGTELCTCKRTCLALALEVSAPVLRVAGRVVRRVVNGGPNNSTDEYEPRSHEEAFAGRAQAQGAGRVFPSGY